MVKHKKAAVLLAVLLAVASVPAGAFAAEKEKAPPETAVSAKEAAKAEGNQTEAPGNASGSGLSVDAKAAILMDAGTGRVLFEQNSHDKLPPASVTKVMTMLLILEAVDRGQLRLDDKVTVSERAASMGGSQMFMEAGEQQTLETLMQGVAICSANDACVAAAEFHSGTVEIFVENMNKRAKELGMKDTHFVNTNGLPVADHHSSAYDIGIMSRELVKFKHTQDWFNTWQTTITVGLPGKKQTEFGLTNTNRLIKQYPGANGIKTGFTQDAGYCLSGSAKKGDLMLIAVILGSPSSKVRFAEAGKLLDYGFANYEAVRLAEKGEPMSFVKLEKASPDTIDAVVPQDITVLVEKGMKEGIKGKPVMKEDICAPVKRNQKVGELVIYQNKKELARYPLVAAESAKKASLQEIYIRMLKEGVK